MTFEGKLSSSAMEVMQMLLERLISLAIESGFWAKIERTIETSSSQSLKQKILTFFNGLTMLLTLRYRVPVKAIDIRD